MEKQLLGTETVHAMHEQGVTSCISGLLANFIESAFKTLGFPYEKKNALTEEVLRVLRSYEPCNTTRPSEEGSVDSDKEQLK